MNNTILNFTGQDAITVGLAVNRQPELLNGDLWVTAASLRQAVIVVKEDATRVRLRIAARVLMEDVCLKPIDPEIPEADFLGLMDEHPGDNDLMNQALAIVRRVYAEQKAN